MRFYPRASMILICASLLPACAGEETSDPPWGLDQVTLPSDQQAFLDAYGDDHAVTMTGLGEAAATEGLPYTALGYLEMLAASGEIEIEDRALDPQADLVYVAGTGTEVSGATGEETTVWIAAWGEPDSEWMFSASGDSREELAAAVEAFVDAVGSSG